ncbi:MAG: methylmalonyl Co-A mutase-associated GTPase MeaB [Myxococcota bacterium]
MSPKRRRLTREAYAAGVRAGDRAVLGQAITLVESRRADDQRLAQAVLGDLAVDARSGSARRIGVTGVPGVGKSTFIERLGVWLADTHGHRVAVLAVDPTSRVSGGSILGDKSRMHRLAQHPRAFIRPSPSAQSLGGVARRTRETMLLCEAAGFDITIVETVGVGQSETMVAEMVDFFLLLMLPGAGDELQGIKRGIIEMADVIAVNKADGDNLTRAREAKRTYGAALRYLRPRHPAWHPEAMLVSGLTGDGLSALWSKVEAHREALGDALRLRRAEQLERWLWASVEEQLMRSFRAHAGVREALGPTTADVRAGRQPPTAAARSLLRAFGLEGALVD